MHMCSDKISHIDDTISKILMFREIIDDLSSNNILFIKKIMNVLSRGRLLEFQSKLTIISIYSKSIPQIMRHIIINHNPVLQRSNVSAFAIKMIIILSHFLIFKVINCSFINKIIYIKNSEFVKFEQNSPSQIDEILNEINNEELKTKVRTLYSEDKINFQIELHKFQLF